MARERRPREAANVAGAVVGVQLGNHRMEVPMLEGGFRREAGERKRYKGERGGGREEGCSGRRKTGTRRRASEEWEMRGGCQVSAAHGLVR